MRTQKKGEALPPTNMFLEREEFCSQKTRRRGERGGRRCRGRGSRVLAQPLLRPGGLRVGDRYHLTEGGEKKKKTRKNTSINEKNGRQQPAKTPKFCYEPKNPLTVLDSVEETYPEAQKTWSRERKVWAASSPHRRPLPLLVLYPDALKGIGLRAPKCLLRTMESEQRKNRAPVNSEIFVFDRVGLNRCCGKLLFGTARNEDARSRG